jgi:hypothetical protein
MYHYFLYHGHVNTLSVFAAEVGMQSAEGFLSEQEISESLHVEYLLHLRGLQSTKLCATVLDKMVHLIESSKYIDYPLFSHSSRGQPNEQIFPDKTSTTPIPLSRPRIDNLTMKSSILLRNFTQASPSNPLKDVTDPTLSYLTEYEERLREFQTYLHQREQAIQEKEKDMEVFQLEKLKIFHEKDENDMCLNIDRASLNHQQSTFKEVIKQHNDQMTAMKSTIASLQQQLKETDVTQV